MMSSAQLGFFEQEVLVCYERLDKMNDPLSKIENVVDWSGLETLMKGIKFDRDYNGKGGRKPLCGLMMAKILLLQSLYNLSDEAVEYQLNDRLSFKRFIGLSFDKKAPDAKTIWLWRERIKHGNLADKIFSWFEEPLILKGYQAQKGQIMDATFVPTHKPTGKHKKQLEEEVPLTKRQAEQIDPDATFTKKNGRSHHGYKNHISIDNQHKFIRKQETSTASLHDSQKQEALLQEVPEEASEADKNVWGDAAYASKEAEKMLKEKGLSSHIHARAYRNSPLSDMQKESNHIRSKVRARVEHIFGHMATSMGGLMIHTMGIARAKVKVTFKNLAYNIQRFSFFEHRKMLTI